MTTDIFGDLREWNRVIEQLERLKGSAQFDEHQDGLARLLRYRYNWRIREKAIQSLSTLSEPDDRILLLVLEIVSDQHTAFDLRTLAADSLRGLISMRQTREQWTGELQETVVERLSATMNPHHPVGFQRAIKRAVDCAQQHECAAVAVWSPATGKSDSWQPRCTLPATRFLAEPTIIHRSPLAQPPAVSSLL